MGRKVMSVIMPFLLLALFGYLFIVGIQPKLLFGCLFFFFLLYSLGVGYFYFFKKKRR